MLRPMIPLAVMLLVSSGCTTLGSAMSPYSKTFSCKNSDHGQCIHPEKAHADAVDGRPARSDPAVTRSRATPRLKAKLPGGDSFVTYRASVYREMQGLIEAPVTPMLKAPRTVRTLLLPYADRQRPDRLYMPRYVYSVLDQPVWVVGDYLVEPVSAGARAPVLEQIRERSGATSETGAAR